MGYYLQNKSYLRPRTRVNTSQKLLALTTAGITVLGAAIIFISLQFGDDGSALANMSINDHSKALNVSETIKMDNTISSVNRNLIDTDIPVVLAAFSVTPDENSIEIKWTAVSEFNNDYFSIEKSEDGSNFSEIGSVNGAATSNATTNYSFNDEKVSKGLIFYRLKQTSCDGSSSYIAIDKVDKKSDMMDLSLYIEHIGPEPFEKYFNINYYSDRKGGVSVELFDKDGNSVFKSYTTSNIGFNTCRFINGDRLRDEEYTLRIANSNGAFLQKIRKKI